MTAKSQLTLKHAGRTHIGCVRTNNEDALLAYALAADHLLMLVADGVAGRDAGELASASTVQVFQGLAESGKLGAARDPQLAAALLAMAIHKAHAEVSRRAVEQRQQRSMSCTLSVALVCGNRLDIGQVGDSRVYRWRRGELLQLSEDQTVAQQLVKDGRIGPEHVATHPDRNTLSQSIGLESLEHPWVPAMSSYELQPGDRVLLCSDGLSDLVDADDIAAHLQAADSAQAAVDALIDAALRAGGRDNVTAVVLFCE